MTGRDIDIERLLAHIGVIKLAYSVDELAEITPLSRFYWYQAINAGHLPAVKANDKTIVLLWDLIRYLNSLPAFTSASGKEERAKRAATLRARRTNNTHRELPKAGAAEGTRSSVKAQPVTPDGSGDKGKEVGIARF